MCVAHTCTRNTQTAGIEFHKVMEKKRAKIQQLAEILK